MTRLPPFRISPIDECTVIDSAGNQIFIAPMPWIARRIVRELTAQNEKWRVWSAQDDERLKDHDWTSGGS